MRQLSGFMTMNLYGGAHESGNQWKHKEAQGFRHIWASRRITTLRPMFWCILICLLLVSSFPTFYIHGGRVTRKVRVCYPNDYDLDSISTCLIYNIDLLLRLGSHALTSGFVYRVGRVVMCPPFLLSEFFWSGTHGQCQIK
jgi:hypothetical protein